MKFTKVLPLAIAAAFALPAIAQTGAPAKPATPAAALKAAGPTSSDMEILRQKLKADKKLVVAANMQLAEAEGKAFWPVYEEYQAELKKLNERLAKVVGEYAEAYKKGPISNELAKKVVNEAVAIDESEAKMRRTLLAKVEKAVGSAKAARYYQIENKIRAVIKYEMAAAIPLVE